MSSTNKTLTIELSQYVGTDKPTYLSDYNGDMLKIDNAIAADRDSITTAQGKADGADAKADANATAIQTLDGQINNASNGLTKRVTDVEGDVNTIESLIGNGTPTTTDKTIIGAINELAGEIPSGTAAGTSYDNTDSGLTATNVQEAIDELNSAIVGGLIAIENVETSSETIAADTSLLTYKDISKAGYTPIGIIGVKNSLGYGVLPVSECFVNNGRASIRVRNIDVASITCTFTLTVLYVKAV